MTVPLVIVGRLNPPRSIVVACDACEREIVIPADLDSDVVAFCPGCIADKPQLRVWKQSSTYAPRGGGGPRLAAELLATTPTLALAMAPNPN